MLTRVLLGIGLALLVAWLALLGGLLCSRPGGKRPTAQTATQALRLLPDLLRLLRRLAADPTLARGVRLRLWLLLGYLAVPIDLIPDFIPLVGHADDAILVAVVLRSVIRRSGPEAITRHWPGNPEGLVVVWRLCGLPRNEAAPHPSQPSAQP
jgi:uncharacterized membrane protein YkvA (DUF1232 family)